MNSTYTKQLAAKLDSNEYDVEDAFQIVMWLNQRKAGYPVAAEHQHQLNLYGRAITGLDQAATKKLAKGMSPR